MTRLERRRTFGSRPRARVARRHARGTRVQMACGLIAWPRALCARRLARLGRIIGARDVLAPSRSTGSAGLHARPDRLVDPLGDVGRRGASRGQPSTRTIRNALRSTFPEAVTGVEPAGRFKGLVSVGASSRCGNALLADPSLIGTPDADVPLADVRRRRSLHQGTDLARGGRVGSALVGCAARMDRRAP